MLQQLESVETAQRPSSHCPNGSEDVNGYSGLQLDQNVFQDILSGDLLFYKHLSWGFLGSISNSGVSRRSELERSVVGWFCWFNTQRVSLVQHLKVHIS